MAINKTRKVPKRIAQTILNSLKGGVVPRIGLPYITVGRKAEIEALLHDVELIENGGASFRFIVGRYGSGKSFLLQTIRNYVMDKNFVVVDGDLSLERRLQGGKGQGYARQQGHAGSHGAARVHIGVDGVHHGDAVGRHAAHQLSLIHIYPGRQIGDAQHILIGFRGQAQHEIQLHGAVPPGEGRAAGLQMCIRDSSYAYLRFRP